MPLARLTCLAALAAVCAVPLAGCYLPLSTAAPQSAATVGQGRFGATLYAEMPTLNLAAKADPAAAPEDKYAHVPFPAMSLQAAYGLTDRLDAEVGIEGTMWFFLFPLPTGFSMGGRYQLMDTGAWDMALAGRAGYVSVEASSGDESDPEDDVYGGRSVYGNLTWVAQLKSLDVVRPGIAWSIIPASISLEEDTGSRRYNALASSLTVSVALVAGFFQAAPFASVVYFTSPDLHGDAWMASAGLSLALRPKKRPPAAWQD